MAHIQGQARTLFQTQAHALPVPLPHPDLNPGRNSNPYPTPSPHRMQTLAQDPKEEVVKLQVGMSAQSLDTETGYRRGQCLALEDIGLHFRDAGPMFDAMQSCDPHMK